jgi:hypothetical protein
MTICKAKEQIDIILVANAHQATFAAVGIEQRGIWNVARLIGGAVRPCAPSLILNYPWSGARSCRRMPLRSGPARIPGTGALRLLAHAGE